MTNCSIPVPCGKCPECLKRRVSAWSFRLMQEDKRSISAHFITITYDTKFVPLTKNGFMTLDKRDMQKFMKRLRKEAALISSVPLKYYLCGEYGGKTKRPHYHMILFNLTNIMLIESAWNRGVIHYGQVNGASIGYTLKYMNKRKNIPAHRNDDRSPEFSLMSKGLGANYLTDSALNYHYSDLVGHAHLTIEDGRKISMPRYYKEKIYTEAERIQISSWQKSQLLKQEEKTRSAYGVMYDRDKAEADMAAFRKMEKSSINRDKF